MKKYNLSEIMKSAWNFKHNTSNVSFSDCLKKAWAIAKGLVVKFFNGMMVTVNGYTRELKLWCKGNERRVYINGGSRNGDGYVDLVRKTINLRQELSYAVAIANMILDMEF